MTIFGHFFPSRGKGGVRWSGVEWGGVGWSGVEWGGVGWSGVGWGGVGWGEGGLKIRLKLQSVFLMNAKTKNITKARTSTSSFLTTATGCWGHNQWRIASEPFHGASNSTSLREATHRSGSGM